MNSQKTIFVVDDNDINLAVAKDVLKDSYRVMTMPSAAKMFSMIEKVSPDLILLDIEMPEMDGFGALKLLKEGGRFASVPVIFLTSVNDADIEARGFELGAVDFVIKPFSAPVLLNRIKSHLDVDALIRERTQKLQTLQNALVFILADMVESRDKETGGHVERTSAYIEILIDEMKKRDVYFDELCAMDKDLLVSSARLHDVGKISISDAILNKPGKLTDEEFDIMKTHTTEGERIIEKIVERADDYDFLDNAMLFAGSHHERWDGKGYPRGTAGEKISLQGRIMAFADVYDALVSERPYKRPFTHEEAVKIILDGAGTQFDPVIAEVFESACERFKDVKFN